MMFFQFCKQQETNSPKIFMNGFVPLTAPLSLMHKRSKVDQLKCLTVSQCRTNILQGFHMQSHKACSEKTKPQLFFTGAKGPALTYQGSDPALKVLEG